MSLERLEAAGVFSGDSGTEIRAVYNALIDAGHNPDDVERLFLIFQRMNNLNTDALEPFKKALIAGSNVSSEKFFEIAQGIDVLTQKGILARTDSNIILDSYTDYIKGMSLINNTVSRYLVPPDKMAELFIQLDNAGLLKQPFLSDFIKIVLDGRVAENLADDMIHIKDILLGREGSDNWAVLVKCVIEGGRVPHDMAVALLHLNNLGYLNDNEGINRNLLVEAALKRDDEGRPDRYSMNAALEQMNVEENKQRKIAIQGINEQGERGGELDQFPPEILNLTASFFKAPKKLKTDEQDNANEIKSNNSSNDKSPKNVDKPR